MRAPRPRKPGKAISPEQLAKSGTEHGEQTALFAWAAASGIAELRWMFAIPNGGERNPVVAANLKAEGVKSGVWDIMLPVPSGNFMGMFLEMKRPGRQREKNGGLSDDQVTFGAAMIAQGYYMSVHYAWDTAAEAIRRYLAHGVT